MTQTIKKITIHYDTLEDLIAREDKMRKTLDNYLTREENYEFYKSHIEYLDNNKAKLVLEIKLKDGNN